MIEEAPRCNVVHRRRLASPGRALSLDPAGAASRAAEPRSLENTAYDPTLAEGRGFVAAT